MHLNSVNIHQHSTTPIDTLTWSPNSLEKLIAFVDHVENTKGGDYE